MIAAARAELEAARREESALGQAALALARRIASNSETGAAVASLTREFRATLEAATKDTGRTSTPLDRIADELAARRRA